MGINALTMGIWAAASSGTSSSDSDPNWSSVVAMLHGETIADVSSTPLSLTNTNVTISTTTFKFGAGSLYFNGSANLISQTAPKLNLSQGDFTIEFFVRPQNFNNDPYFIGIYGGVTTRLALQCNSSGNVQLWGAYNYSNYNTVTTSGRLLTSEFRHVALCRSASTWYLFVHGVLVYTGAFLSQLANVSCRLELGAAVFNNSNYFTGYLDDIRITKGVARYTSNFTPPAAPFPNQ